MISKVLLPTSGLVTLKSSETSYYPVTILCLWVPDLLSFQYLRKRIFARTRALFQQEPGGTLFWHLHH